MTEKRGAHVKLDLPQVVSDDSARETPAGGRASYSRDAYENRIAKAKKKRGPWFVVMVVAIIVLIGSVGALGAIGFSYWQGQHKYDQVAQMAGFDVSSEADALIEELAEATVDWDALLAANPDTVAWVYIPGTKVNYPVVQAADNDYYLTVDFDGTAGWLAEYGAVFLDYRNAHDLTDPCNFVYGHHMKDGSMFADIAKMADQQLFDAARTAYLLTPTGNFRLRSFSLVHCDANDPLVQQKFASDEERVAYIQDKMDRSVVAVDDAPPASEIDHVYALATCDSYSSGRYILYCWVQDTTAVGLTGNLGLASGEDGAVAGWDEGLQTAEEAVEAPAEEAPAEEAPAEEAPAEETPVEEAPAA